MHVNLTTIHLRPDAFLLLRVLMMMTMMRRMVNGVWQWCSQYMSPFSHAFMTYSNEKGFCFSFSCAHPIFLSNLIIGCETIQRQLIICMIQLGMILFLVF